MSLKSATRFHSSWGQFATPADLPNSVAATVQDGALEDGDTAYSISDLTLYYCTDPTIGAAVWVPAGGGLPVLKGAGNPNGVTLGSLGQLYFAIGFGTFFVCDSDPNGTSWIVV